MGPHPKRKKREKTSRNSGRPASDTETDLSAHILAESPARLVRRREKRPEKKKSLRNLSCREILSDLSRLTQTGALTDTLPLPAVDNEPFLLDRTEDDITLSHMKARRWKKFPLRELI
ncbi:hypothetical protein AOLI_G00264530 [Acnodon oligacanthus]